MSDLSRRSGTSHQETCCPASMLTVLRPCYSGGKEKDGALEPVPAERPRGIFLQTQWSVLETATGRRRSLSDQPRQQRKRFTDGELTAALLARCAWARVAPPIKNMFFWPKRAPATQQEFHNFINQQLKRRAPGSAEPPLAGGRRRRCSISWTDVNNQPLPPSFYCLAAKLRPDVPELSTCD